MDTWIFWVVAICLAVPFGVMPQLAHRRPPVTTCAPDTDADREAA